ncbi:hypothetical protein [Sphingopyxis indica]|uniref:Uncharacterized protein n=1 Tax=Sphingopyxis indica TaxID=436663 RepID=A0A239FZB6_9SPHN|nr:hypothetical protein [Sphingopyxis indica]SNS62085.1 hypothetical protein SAMN06295955_102311 [Sphingopyxis indica]
MKAWIAGAALALAAAPGAASAQDGAKLDCISGAASPELKAALGTAMAGSADKAGYDSLFGRFSEVVDSCAAEHGIGDEFKAEYFNYGLARIARDWLTGEIAKASLSTGPVDKALDFGIDGTNPDLANDMNEDQIMAIVAAYQEAGVDVEAVDQAVWEKVGAYAAATSLYWSNRRKLTP